MSSIETRGAFYEGALEIRQDGDRPTLTGRFPYGSTATISDRGRVRKERFMPHAFRYAVEVAQPLQDILQEAVDELRQRQIDLLVGHSYNRPLASTRNGTLVLTDSADAVTFTATLPPAGSQPSWVRDAIDSIDSGLMKGISPGFKVPPANVVPNAQGLVPEVGNPDVLVREINEAVLNEFSIVTRPSYTDTEIDLREQFPEIDLHEVLRRRLAIERRAALWL